MNHNTTDNHETAYRGMLTGGFAMLGVIIVLIALAGWTFTTDSPAAVIAGGIAIAAAIICMCGFMTLEPNEAMVMLFFGKYQGTVRRVGFSWANPFMTKRKISLRIRNLDVEPIKVNDRTGNPILIGLVLVWRVTDTYRAGREVDTGAGKYGAGLAKFGAIQS
ncbi:MAG: SPFH domain-containing protein, partial [Paramuribaculum sp.]|nr:SPFH domain-containing protein [Paramuribaculum sp.]